MFQDFLEAIDICSSRLEVKATYLKLKYLLLSLICEQYLLFFFFIDMDYYPG